MVVFDGQRLPMKREVEDARDKARVLHRAEGDKLWKEGDADLAVRKYAEAIDISSRMAREFIQVLRQRRVEFIVAPYEADAQMAYLFREGLVSLVMTEDSDLLAFGCSRVLYKLDNEGYGEEIDLRNLAEAKELDFSRFDQDKFLRTCILSGCDYLPSIKGIGFKKAHKYMAELGNLDEVVNAINKEVKHPVPARYKEDFERAFLTFKFQTVFDPRSRRLTSLQPMSGTKYVEIFEYFDKSFLGKYRLFIPFRLLPTPVAAQLADGELDPVSLEPYREDREEQEMVEWAYQIAGERITILPEECGKLSEKLQSKSVAWPEEEKTAIVQAKGQSSAFKFKEYKGPVSLELPDSIIMARDNGDEEKGRKRKSCEKSEERLQVAEVYSKYFKKVGRPEEIPIGNNDVEEESAEVRIFLESVLGPGLGRDPTPEVAVQAAVYASTCVKVKTEVGDGNSLPDPGSTNNLELEKAKCSY